MVVYFEKVVVLGYRCEYRFESGKSTSGTFQSPNFPGPYPDNVYCHYYLTGSKDERIRVSFDVFQLEDRQEAGCLFDYMEIHAVDTDDVPYFVDRLCGKKIPRPIVTKFYKLEITFRSDYVKGYVGFKARYEFLSDDWVPFPPSNEQCGPDYMTGEGGVIESPGFPFFKPDVECVWMIKVKEDQKILLAYQALELGKTVYCTDTAIEIYNGFASKSERPAERVCGQLHYYGKGVKEFLSSGFRIVIRYTSGKEADNVTTGFRMSWTAVSEPEICTGFQCRGGRFCLDRNEMICSDLTTYCIDRSLRCDGTPHCGSYDKSDEDGCIGPYDNTTVILWATIASFILMLIITTFCLIFCVIRHQKHERRGQKSEQARRLASPKDGSLRRQNSRISNTGDSPEMQRSRIGENSLESTNLSYELEPINRSRMKNTGVNGNAAPIPQTETALLSDGSWNHVMKTISTGNSDYQQMVTFRPKSPS